MNELPEGLLSRRFSRWFLWAWLPLFVCAIAVRWYFSRHGETELIKTNIFEVAKPIDDAALWKFSPKTKSPNEEAIVRYVSFSPDGRTLAFPTEIYWPLSPEEKAREESRQSAASENWQFVRSVKMTPRHRRFEIQLWDLPSRSYKTSLFIPANYRGFYNSLSTALFSRDGTKICLPCDEFLIWDIETGSFHSSPSTSKPEDFALLQYPKMSEQENRNSRETNWSGDRLSFAAKILNPDLPRRAGEYVFPGEFVKLWHRDASTKTWREAGNIASTRFNDQLIYGIELNHEGRILAVLHGRKLELFETKSLKSVKNLALSGNAFQLNFSPDGRYLMSNVFPFKGGVERRATTYFWNVESGEVEKTLDFSAISHEPVFSPDGKWIASTDDKTVFIYPSPVYSTE